MLSISRTADDAGIKALSSRIIIARKERERDPRVADAFRELDRCNQASSEPLGSDGAAEVWSMNELLRAQFQEVLRAPISITPSPRPTKTFPKMVPLGKPPSEPPTLVAAPKPVHGPDTILRAKNELQTILLGQVAAVKQEKEAEDHARAQRLLNRPAAVLAAEADRTAKVQTWAGRQALGQMTSEDMARLTIDDADEIDAIFAWAPSKISVLDPKNREEDLTGTATWRDHTDREWSNVSSQGFERNIRMREGRRGLQPLP